MSFFAGDTSSRGEVNVRYILRLANRLGYRYVMRLIHTNEYCIYGLDKPPSQCRETVKAKGNGYP